MALPFTAFLVMYTMSYSANKTCHLAIRLERKAYYKYTSGDPILKSTKWYSITCNVATSLPPTPTHNTAFLSPCIWTHIQ
ncbi:hypothetical protein NC652_010245 [Populus alba x Populus x berolinensis]|nr:hypothetical protein NC652_010245 [Populus alba x Populus x berolinensis]